jgi:hypothetical protein
MTVVTPKRPARLLAVTAATCVVTMLVLPLPAAARPYTVVSCNAAVGFGFNAGAWSPFNRMTGRTYSALEFSSHVFTAPPGTTITGIRWGGRLARANCDWGTIMRALPSALTVIGTPNGKYCGSNDFDISNWPISYPVPAGTTRLDQLVICGALRCAPGAAMHSHVLEVTIDDPQPPSISLSGSLVSGQWVSGASGSLAQLAVTATDNAGVQSIHTALGAHSPDQSYPCDWSHSQPCVTHATMTSGPSVAELPDGRHTLWVGAVDAAGNNNLVAREVYVDNTSPDPIVPLVAGGTGWRRTNGFDVSWTNGPNNAAPITSAHWKLCRADGTCPSRGTGTGVGIHELRNLLVPAPGEYRLRVWLEDAAGNQREANAAVSVPVRFDPDPPELAFLPLDPADPLRVAVSAIDRHSGLANGEIEMRASGSQTWHGIPTEHQGTQLAGYVDDERFRRGTYEFRARAEDYAGNEASTGTRTDGTAAMLRLPARIDTRLSIGLLRKLPRRVHSRHRRLDSDVSTGYGRRLRLSGRLSNADGQPIEAATLEAIETRSDGTRVPIGLATTGREGRFHYVVRATRNRVLLFHYVGSRRIGAARAAFRLRVRASSSINVSRARVRNGQAVVFTGRVASRPLPPAGKLIEMQAHFRGRWRTFSTVRSDRAGLWRFPYRFGATLGRVTYRFRARLPLEGGYPFVTGHSRVANVVVIGP